MAPILTIGITSYKRVKELVRCIKSIRTKYIDDIEILISEDHSPLSNEIKNEVTSIAENSPYKIIFSTNQQNLGYDMNLGSIIKKSNGKYIFFMSDDDALYKGCLDNIIPILKSRDDIGVYYAPYVHVQKHIMDRNHRRNIIIESGEKNAAKYIYDSILFSGLVFNKQYVEHIDSERFKNHNYFQVYLFLTMIYNYGGYYCKHPSVLCIEDGENAYGISESSGGNQLLANRKSIKSNLEFNKTLFKVIEMFDTDNNTSIMTSFSKQYSLHSYSGMSIARAEGKIYFNEYWKMLNDLNIKLHPITKAYYVILYIFGKRISDKLLAVFKLLVKR